MKTGLICAVGTAAVPVLACCSLAGIGGPALAAQAPACRAGSFHVNGTMAGVAADSATTAWAVGNDGSRPLIARWNGHRWRPVPGAPGVTGSLNGVAASSRANAWAVGDDGRDNPVIEHWNGRNWTKVPDHRPGTRPLGAILGIAVTSRANAWAATDNGYAQHWNGTAWQ